MRRLGFVALVLVLAALAGVAAAAQRSDHRAGSPDRNFSGNGMAQIGLVRRPSCQGDQHGRDCNDFAYSMAIDSRGRIIVGGITDRGNHGRSGIVRLRANGDLDDSFADGGIALPRKVGYDVATDTQDRIILGGANPTRHTNAARLKVDGSLDATFGGDGRVQADFGTTVATDDSDRVLVAGPGDNSPLEHPFGALALERFLADGSPDPAFSPTANAYAFDEYRLDATSIATDDSGAVFVACLLQNIDDPDAGTGTGGLAKFLPDGELDASFGDDGTILASNHDFHEYLSVSVDSQGRIVAGGERFIDRYLPDGTPDPAFSDDGRIRVRESHDRFRVSALAVDDQDRVVATGDGVLARFKANGKLDRAFGDHGVAAAFGRASAVSVDRRGKIVTVGGKSHGRSMLDSDYAVARYHGG